MKQKRKLLVITGEPSGELLAVDVVKELKAFDIFEFIGTGGELLKKEGMTIIESIENMAVVGIVEIIKSYSFLKNLMNRILTVIKERNIQSVLLVDYPGFNLRLAKKIKKINKEIQIFYLVSPQIWAWNYNRIKIIKENIDFMFVLFSFEKEMYDKEHVASEWIGHPIKFRISRELRKQKPIPTKGKPVIGILPGSRFSEVSKLLIPMLESARLIQKKYPKTEFLLPVISSNLKLKEYIYQTCEKFKDLNLKIFLDSSLTIMKQSNLLILASGTATLEATYLKKPMIICYKVNILSYIVFSVLVKTKYIGLPNLLSKEEVAVELLQNEVDPKYIFYEAVKILENEDYRKKIIKNLSKIKLVPQNQNPAKITAEILRRYVGL